MGAEGFAAAILGNLKNVAPVPLIATLVATGVILFIPDPAAEALGIKQIRVDHRPWLGVAFIGSTAYLAALMGHAGWIYIVGKHRRWKQDKATHRPLHELTSQEKEYLRPYIFGRETSQFFSVSDGIARGLEAKRILLRTTSITSIREMSFAFNIQPWARRYLMKKPHLLADDSDDLPDAESLKAVENFLTGTNALTVDQLIDRIRIRLGQINLNDPTAIKDIELLNNVSAALVHHVRGEDLRTRNQAGTLKIEVERVAGQWIDLHPESLD